MTAHELAALLLKGPDLPVAIEMSFELCQVTDVNQKTTMYDGACIELSTDGTLIGDD